MVWHCLPLARQGLSVGEMSKGVSNSIQAAYMRYFTRTLGLQGKPTAAFSSCQGVIKGQDKFLVSLPCCLSIAAQCRSVLHAYVT